MRIINFSDGREEIKINGKSVFLHLADPNIYLRLNNLKKSINEMLTQLDVSPSSNEEAVKLLESIDGKIKAEINALFDYDVSDVLFGSCSPLTPVDEDGTPYIEALLDNLMPLIEEELDKSAKASEAKIRKHTAKYELLSSENA